MKIPDETEIVCMEVELNRAMTALRVLRAYVKKLEAQAEWWNLPLQKTLSEIVTSADQALTHVGEASAVLKAPLPAEKEEGDAVRKGSIQGLCPGSAEDQRQHDTDSDQGRQDLHETAGDVEGLAEYDS